ncbi:MAG: hypothetical protein RBS19_03285 [Bacteroidales bacterium]|nr:hypothetical protein [Bacteroidales bacterium]
MGLEESIELAMRKMSKKFQISEIVTGVAKNVTSTKCDVHRDNAPTLFDVRLNAIDDSLESYVTIYPDVDSNVIVGIIEGQKTEAVVLRCSEVGRIKIKIGEMSLLFDAQGAIFNEGSFKGLVKIEELITKINRIEAKLKSHQHAYVPYPSGAPATPVLTTAASAAVPPDSTLVFDNTQLSDLENTKIKH